MGYTLRGQKYSRKANMYRNVATETLNMVRYHLPNSMLPEDQELLRKLINGSEKSILVHDPEYYNTRPTEQDLGKILLPIYPSIYIYHVTTVNFK